MQDTFIVAATAEDATGQPLATDGVDHRFVHLKFVTRWRALQPWFGGASVFLFTDETIPLSQLGRLSFKRCARSCSRIRRIRPEEPRRVVYRAV